MGMTGNDFPVDYRAEEKEAGSRTPNSELQDPGWGFLHGPWESWEDGSCWFKAV